MKIAIPGHKLQKALQEQLDRVEAKRLEFEAYMEQHTATHGRRPNTNELCAQELQAEILYNSMACYERKMRAAIDVLDSQSDYKMSMTRYLGSYVACPYDNIVIPDNPADEVDIRDFHVN